MYCGLCTEACPYEAIQPGGTFRDAVYWFDDMYHDKYELTKLAHEHLRKNDFTYPNGLKAPQSVVDFINAENAGLQVAPPPGTHAQIPSQPSEGTERKDTPRQERLTSG
jgi:ferredoxin